MYAKAADNYSKKSHAGFAPFKPFFAADNQDEWNKLDEDWKREAIALAEKYIDYKYPSILATDFLNFSRTGNRTDYEDLFFAKRHALCALVLGECAEYKDRFTDAIINGIFSICEESAWFLPAHNTYVRDTPQMILPDATDPVGDLFSAETGALLACTYYLLQSKLDNFSPIIGKRILCELNKRIFAPYLNRHFWWMGNGKEPMNNWTIWCTQNILIAAFLAPCMYDCAKEIAPGRNSSLSDDDYRDIYEGLSPVDLSQIFEKACKSIDYFLDEYGEDGCCDEGAQYYHHAGLCIYQATSVLNAVTGGSFNFVYDTPKIKNIASYIANVRVGGSYYVNFADCSPLAGLLGSREYLFAKATDNKEMMDLASRDFCENLASSLTMADEYNLYYRLQNAFAVSAIKSHYKTLPAAVSVSSDIFYPSVGMFIARDNTYTLAAKAGDNADSHNHNDVGSITVYKNNLPLLIDVGVESYTKKTFSPQRYEIWTMQSAYHNLPTFDGIMEKDGKEYAAANVEAVINQNDSYLSMDIAGAFPKEAGLKYYTRKAVLHKNEGIELSDSMEFKKGADKSCTLSFMTYERPRSIDKNTLAIGDLGQIVFEGVDLVSVEEIPITDPRLMITWKHDIYRILAHANGKSVSAKIK